MISVIQGDVIEVLKDYPDEFFNAVFCDPPYGLKFMGKEWDHGVPATPYWAKILRVLKPGAILMAFSGTRTWHRLGVAIEDAGFQLFDTMMWLHGQGFPKSHNIGKAIDKAGGASALHTEARKSMARDIRCKREQAGLSRKQLAAMFPQYGFVTENWERLDAGFRVPSLAAYEKLVQELDVDPQWRDQVRAEDLRSKRIGIRANRKGDGTTYGLGHSGNEYETTTDAAKIWEGYGTSLKPAFEPILLARKPRTATYAKTAMKHHTACLNIDGCRIVSAKPYVINTWDDGAKPFGDGAGHPFTGRQQSGRWPANLLLSHTADCIKVGVKKVKQRSGSVSGKEPSHTGDENTTCYGEYSRVAWQRHADPDGTETVEAWRCSPDCPVAMLDRQSGMLKSGAVKGGKPYHLGRFEGQKGARGLKITMPCEASTGGASRFFKTFEGERFCYCAKANKRERNMGLPEGERNLHTTVKPLALCKYLAQLIVPPEEYRDEAELLVPFAGVMSEVIGAFLAGWRNITAIELEKEYCEIGQERIDWWFSMTQNTGLTDPRVILKRGKNVNPSN